MVYTIVRLLLIIFVVIFFLDFGFILDICLFQHVAVVVADILPVVEGVAVGLDGYGGLVLIHEELYEDFIRSLLAEKDELALYTRKPAVQPSMSEHA